VWMNIGKQLINLDKVASIEVAKNYVYLYGNDGPSGSKSTADGASNLPISVRCNTDMEAQERYEKMRGPLGAIVL
jgi:hypothetical protein